MYLSFWKLDLSNSAIMFSLNFVQDKDLKKLPDLQVDLVPSYEDNSLFQY
jgi:hypothetical protein